MTTKEELLREYCNRGWKLHPLRPRTKEAVLNDWQHKATDDWNTVETWSARYPNANWGIVLGPSGLVVVDEDEGYAPEEWCLPPSLSVKTGRSNGRGVHTYFSAPSATLKTTKYEWGEVRAGDVYVVVPPSIHPDGPEYRWISDPLNDELRTFPIENLQPPESKRTDNGKYVEGERNESLFRLASRLRGKGADYEDILGTVTIHNIKRCSPSLSPKEVETIVGSASKYEPEKGETLSDEGNAIRFVRRFFDDVRYVYGLDVWLIWDGNRWKEDRTAHVYRLASQVAEELLDDAEAETSDVVRKAKHANHKRMQSRQGIDACLYLARTFSEISLLPEDVDNAPYTLNCLNGQVDLRTGELKPHGKNPVITKIVHVAYDPEARCPVFMGYLQDWFGDDEETKKTIQTAVGASLTGSGGEQSFIYLYGRGKNGKTSLLRVIAKLFKEYTVHVPVNIFTVNKNIDEGEGPSPYTAKMFNARFVMTTEIPQGKKLNTSKIKDASGGDQITARGLRQSPIDFQQTWMIWLFGNHKLANPDESEGMWRRLNLVPFPYTIPEEKRVRSVYDLVNGLAPEYSGILNWAVQGAMMWAEGGLHRSESVTDATAEYRVEEDVLGQFIDEHCEQAPDYSVTKGEFYNSYEVWAKDEAGYALAKKSVTRRLKDIGITVGGDGKSKYQGIRLMGGAQWTSDN
jgi:putative DNA primase/helicase